MEKLWDKIEYSKPKEFQNIKVKKEWKVDGSKGKKYLVELDGNRWTCECHSFGWSGHKRTCKHVEAKKAELQEQTDYNNKLCMADKMVQSLKNNWQKKQRIYKSKME